jgi:hypothetical protein
MVLRFSFQVLQGQEPIQELVVQTKSASLYVYPVIFPVCRTASKYSEAMERLYVDRSIVIRCLC